MGAGEVAVGTGRIRRYDFRVPEKFSKEVLRQVGHLFEGVCRSLTTSLSAQLRTTVRVEAPQAQQETYQVFLQAAHHPGVLATFAAEPLSGRALLEVEPELAYAMIDRLLGGPGQGTPHPSRPMTEIEATVIQRVLQAVLAAWRDGWAQVAELHPRILGMETNPLFVQVAAPGDIVLAVRLSASLGSVRGQLRFCLPYTLLEPVLKRLAAAEWVPGATGPGGGGAELLARRLRQVQVAARVDLARLRVPFRQVLAWREGEVLPLGLPVDAPAVVAVGGRPYLRGRIAEEGGRLVVRITEALSE
jgi:flagellar motor switch protein FliM